MSLHEGLVRCGIMSGSKDQISEGAEFLKNNPLKRVKEETRYDERKDTKRNNNRENKMKKRTESQ